MKKITLIYCFILSIGLTICKAEDTKFALVKQGIPSRIEYFGKEQVINTAIEIYCSDMEKITGLNPRTETKKQITSIYVGVLSEESTFDKILKKYKIDVADIKNEWEAFKIITISDTNNSLLLVIGSDTRGAAYGVMELLKISKVSPWVWWADVPYPKLSDITLPVNYCNVKKPSVRYRGIFINDEDWGLVPWSAQFEKQPIEGKVGPKTYSKIFELMLRLRMNTIWPAMHPSTEAFYFVEGNMEAAIKYGIIVGTSHCEPMMRNNVGEWDEKLYGKYDFTEHRDAVTSYWNKRTEEVAKTEVITTLGMRGIHDDKMEGAETLDEQTELTNQVIKVQREILSKNHKNPIASIPQTFVPYKEVLKIYDNGLNIPDDVTLTWCDDNYGYITRLSNKKEIDRSGGSGIYYHVSYWGKPHDYLWLATTQPSLVYNEMKKAWNYGARKLWILNVGDIKPSEYHMQFFSDMAWNIDTIKPDNIYEHQEQWLTEQFPGTDSDKIMHIMQEQYRLAAIRKPEHMGWSRVQQQGFERGLSPVIDSEFNTFDGSLRKRLEQYTAIEKMSTEILKSIPSNQRDAFWQIVHYPVCGATEMNRKLLFAQNARRLADKNKFVAKEYARMSSEAYNKIQQLTYFYNNEINGGKWKGMMDSNPRGLDVFKPAPVPEIYGDTISNVVCIDGISEPIAPNRGCSYTWITDNSLKVTIYGKTSSPDWKIDNKPHWMDIKANKGNVDGEIILTLSANKHSEESIQINFVVDGHEYPLDITIKDTKGISPNCHIEKNGIVAINAYEHNSKGMGVDYSTEGLGHSEKSITLKRTTREELSLGMFVEYYIYTYSSGKAEITSGFIPVHAVNGGDISYAISVDGETPQIVQLNPEVFDSEEWKVNVLRNQSRGSIMHNFDRTGLHKIRICALSDNMVFDQLMINFALGQKYYEIPVK